MLISCSGYCVGAQLIIKLNYESITHICPSDIRLWLDGGDHWMQFVQTDESDDLADSYKDNVDDEV